MKCIFFNRFEKQQSIDLNQSIDDDYLEILSIFSEYCNHFQSENIPKRRLIFRSKKLSEANEKIKISNETNYLDNQSIILVNTGIACKMNQAHWFISLPVDNDRTRRRIWLRIKRVLIYLPFSKNPLRTWHNCKKAGVAFVLWVSQSSNVFER